MQTSPQPKGKARAKPSRPAPATVAADTEGTAWSPTSWRPTWDLIVELRADRTAVVDRVGSEQIAARSNEPDEDTRHYQTLISLMLSSQTRDITTAETMVALREHGLSVANILDNTSDDQLRELIKKVGFYNNKTTYIRKTTQIIRDQHGGKTPACGWGLKSGKPPAQVATVSTR